MTFGPEEVEEEGGAEDGGDEDADEDVIRGYADVVVVVDSCAVFKGGNEILLVDIICGQILLVSGYLKKMGVLRAQRCFVRSNRSF